MIKLLVVDDEKGITDSLKGFFEKRGFSVEAANSGGEAIEIVARDKPHIIFLDVKMRGMDGIEALEKIKKIDSSVKVIMLTVIGDTETLAKAMSLGAEDYVEKPFRLDYLEDLVIKKVQKLVRGKEDE